MRRSLARGLGVLAGYLAVLAWLTWPLAAHLTTHLPFTKVAQTDVPYIPTLAINVVFLGGLVLTATALHLDAALLLFEVNAT